ncbi:cytochrome P450 [Dentipellis sp. KUC8613]|nr:cytochrome P450 [Dentipellis sp. KUC8613]
MYPIGLHSVLDVVQANLSIWTMLYLIGILAFLVHFLSLWPAGDDEAVALPGRLPFTIAPFFRTRFDFINSGFHATNERIFRFRLLTNSVMVVSGEQGRRDFFNARHLDLQEGFRVLSGALPFVQGVTADLRQRRIAQIYKRLATVQRNDRLTELMPGILEDCRRVMSSWGNTGAIDPFEGIYGLVFQLSVRCLTCAEIADDPAVVSRLKGLYDQVDRGTTAATVLFPWFPSPAMLMKLRATKQIYDLVVEKINVRKASGVSHNDSLQMLLDAGDDHSMIVGFIMGLLIAGARSTGTIASWLITFLGCYPEWRGKALCEVQQLLAANYADNNFAAPADMPARLAGIPLTAWETATPVLDSLIRETLRMAQPHVAMRRNLGPTMHIDGKVLPKGAFAIYPFADVHLDPELYPDPFKFDPARPVRKEDFGYIGWGGGRVNCLGTRLAKLQLKLIAAMFLLNLDFKIVDGDGAPADPHPKPNWNDVLSCRPADGSFFLDYRRLGTSCLS